jgi:hypothetical protein
VPLDAWNRTLVNGLSTSITPMYSTDPPLPLIACGMSTTRLSPPTRPREREPLKSPTSVA